MTSGSLSNKTSYNERSLKSNGAQKQNAGFKETQGGICLFSLPIGSTLNRN